MNKRTKNLTDILSVNNQEICSIISNHNLFFVYEEEKGELDTLLGDLYRDASAFLQVCGTVALCREA